MGNLPYLEAQILQCTDPKSKILEFLGKKAERYENAHSIINSDKILIEFSSLEYMQRAYGTATKIVEKFYQLLLEKKEDLHLFDFQNSTSNQKSKAPEVAGNSLYLTLKYQTNAKDVIRAKYNFTYKIIDLCLRRGKNYLPFSKNISNHESKALLPFQDEQIVCFCFIKY